MKALVQDRYVSAEGVVHIGEIDRPLVEDDEVLVQVRGASAKMYGWDLPAIVQSIGRVTARFRSILPVPGRLELHATMVGVRRSVLLQTVTGLESVVRSILWLGHRVTRLRARRGR